jgi:hypothetical protein
MNFTHTTTRRLFERGSLMLAGATLLGASASANTGEYELLERSLAAPSTLTQPASLSSLREALQGGTFWASFRYRYENVDQEGFSSQANASTLQSRLGYKSAEWKGFTGVLEFADVASIGASDDHYNDGTGPATSRPVVLDPVGAQVNQSYLGYSSALGGFKFGRQRFALDNKRFVGNVGWRQTEQNYDAISYMKNLDNGFRAIYCYIANVNTVLLENQKSDTHLLNLSQNWDNIGRLVVYGYRLDYDVESNFSQITMGARFAGERATGDVGLLYGIEYAHQTDTADNPNDVDANYSHAMIGGKLQGAAVKVGFEVLEGSRSNDPNRAFQTPLATKNAFNGWADQFLDTPGGGLEDTYVDISYGTDEFMAGIIYHKFEPEQSSVAAYGDELDIVARYTIAEDLTIGARYADFDADSAGGMEDVSKLWLWLAYSF